MMQLLVAVFMIKVIMSLIGNKNKEKKINGQINDEQVDARHPAGFQVR
ncbi:MULTISPECIES: hypothetical protein [Niastella]|uniref:Uncharacterized protein n=1 Tax=Niastella soli TaxID=2821487 RepID=A0ABS3YQH2_9BACT|nr:hypothetical protein [Niastella soli]MBO9200120.1 hypothetical protein [Niastella soli]